MANDNLPAGFDELESTDEGDFEYEPDDEVDTDEEPEDNEI